MNINCEIPLLQGLDEKTKLKKIECYLYALDQQLKIVLSNIDLDNFTVETKDELQVSAASKKKAETEFKQTVESLKQKIINTAESIESDLVTIRENMEGHYKAISDQFGTYNADFFRETTKNALATIEEFKQVENINGYYLASQGYIKTGNIGTDEEEKAIYGIEIGDVQDESGTKLRFCNNAIHSIENGDTVWYIDEGEVYAHRLIVKDYIYLGGYRVEVTDGIEFKWEGGDEE